MIKRCLTLAIVFSFIFLTVTALAETTSKSEATAPQTLEKPMTPPYESTKARISRSMNNIVYGSVELPDNIDETRTKGTQMDRCEKRTRTGVERGIARVVGGLWQLATFWYSDPGCVTKAPTASSSTSRSTSEMK